MHWKRLTIKTTVEAQETILRILDRFGAELVQSDGKEGLCVIMACLPWDLMSYGRIKNIKDSLRRLRASRLNVGPCTVRISSYDDGEPVQWSTIDPDIPIPPMHAGRRIVVKGQSEEYQAEEGEKVINIKPGRAWGTGHHPTTIMCIMALEKFVKAGSTVIDLGCGTGILGMTAAVLGAKSVLAIDIEDEAVAHARENVAANNLGEIVRLQCRDGFDGVEYCADLIVANIIGGVLDSKADAFFEHLTRGGILICSGLDEDRRQLVQEAMERCGFEHVEDSTDDRWVALVFRKPL
jgi:ribosomal protein L11 methyltransferase